MPYYEDVDYFDAMKPADEWKPTYWTPMKTTATLGNDICDFIEAYLAPPRKFGDEEFKVRPWQRWLLCHMFELNSFGLLRYNQIYLQIPRKNGKSFLASAIMLYFLFKAKPGYQLYAAAKNREQARVVYDESLAQVYANPILKRVIKPGQYKMENRFVRAMFAPLSGDAGGAHGKAVFGCIGDELHTWSSRGVSTRGEELYGALTTSSKDRDEWFFLGATTAGETVNGLAHKLYDYGKMVATGQIPAEERFGFYCWEAEETDDIYDEKTWYKCNPQLTEKLLSIEEFRSDLVKAEATSTADFERYALNKWLQGNGDAADFITPFHWKNAAKPGLKIPKGNQIAVGFDGSLTEDSTGIVAIDITPESPTYGLIEILYGWEKPQKAGDDWFVDVEEVEAAMDNVFRDYDVLKLYADPSRHQATVQKWQRQYGRGKVRDIPPSSQRMAPMSQAFKGAVYTGKLSHGSDVRLTNHVLNAIETIKGVPNKRTRNSPYKIDFLACSVLGFGAMQEIESRNSRKGQGIITF